MRRRHTAGRGRALKIERVKRPVFGPLEKGDIVRHATWGEGEVVRVVGDSIYTFFPVHGEKLLKAQLPREDDSVGAARAARGMLGACAPTLAQRQVATWSVLWADFGLPAVGRHRRPVSPRNIGPLPTNRLPRGRPELRRRAPRLQRSYGSPRSACSCCSSASACSPSRCSVSCPPPRASSYSNLHMNTAESVFELVGGLISLALWFRSK